MIGAYGGGGGGRGVCGGLSGCPGGDGCTTSIDDKRSYKFGGNDGDIGGPAPNTTKRLLQDCSGHAIVGRCFIGQ